MPTTQVTEQILVTFPETFRLEPSHLGTNVLGANNTGSFFRRNAPSPLPHANEVEAALASGLSQHEGFTELNHFQLTPTVDNNAPAELQPIALNVTVGEEEDAVLLVVQNGVYSWILPEKGEEVEAAVHGSGTPSAPVLGAAKPKERKRKFRFDVTRDTTVNPQEDEEQKTLGLGPDFVYDAIRTIVFKIAVPKVVNGVIELFESRAPEGLIHVSGPEPKAWSAISHDPDVPFPLPAVHAAGAGGSPPIRRVLLLIHGAFSSTKGSYCGLAATDEGKTFLNALTADDSLCRFDVVLGFNHHTLGKTPKQNAEGLYEALQGIRLELTSGGHARLHVSVVAYSRGGLVYRSLVEQVIPDKTEADRLPIEWKSVVFVGATNSGTLFASADNWKTFADVYTNLAVGACQALTLLPHGAAVAGVSGELFKGLGGLVKSLASYAVGNGGIPGLAAMAPDSDLVKALNTRPLGESVDKDASYYVVTSSFGPDKTALESAAGRLIVPAIKHLVSSLMHEANDLVVNTKSARNFGSTEPARVIAEERNFEPGPLVYHLNYFVQSDVAKDLMKWLAS